MLGLFKLGRLLRLNDIIYFLKTTDDVKSSLKLVKLILYLVVYAHCFACLWWFIIKSDKLWIPPIDIPWGHIDAIYNEEIMTMYLYSIQVSVWTIIGVDIMPRNTFQTVIVSVGLFFGAVINANIFGELALILSDMNK